MKTSNHKTMSATEQAFWNKVKQSIFTDRGAVVLMFVVMIVGFLVELV
jgi:hypothetical protein